MNDFVAGIWGNIIASLLYDSLKKGKESLAQAIQGDEFSRIVNEAIAILAEELEQPGREMSLFLINGLFAQERVSAEIEKLFVGRSSIDRNVILDELNEVLDRRAYSGEELLEAIGKFENILRDLVARQSGVEVKFLFADLDAIRSEIADVRDRLATLVHLMEERSGQSSITVERGGMFWAGGDVALGGSKIEKYYLFPPRQRETPDLEPYLRRIVSTGYKGPSIRLRGSVLGRDEVLDLLGMHDRINRFLVVGESGSGKTWLLRQLLVLHAQQAQHSLSCEGQEIPVYVKLNCYKAGATLEGLILDSFKRYGGLNLTRPNLQRLLTNGGLLLLLDGLSEARDWRPCIDMLVNYFSFYSTHRCWITSRVLKPGWSDYLQKKLGIGKDQTVRICRPCDEDIEAYLRAKAKAGLLEDRLVARLFEGLKEQSDYEYLARSPMMLSILSAEVAAIGDQPEIIAKGQLFKNHVARLLEGHGASQVSAEIIWNGLSWFAFEMQMKQTLRLEQEKVLAILRDFIASGKGDEERTEDVPELTEQLFGALTALPLWDPLAWEECVEFVNPAMQAFFAACQLKDHLSGIGLSGLDQFSLSSPWWGEVITFLAGVLEEQEALDLVAWLSQQYPTLAARCIVEGTRVSAGPMFDLIKRLYYNQGGESTTMAALT